MPTQAYPLPLAPAQLFRQGIESADEACQKKYGKPVDPLAAAPWEEALPDLSAGKMG